MIKFESVSKTFVMDGKRKTIMNNVSIEFPSGRSVGLLGRNGAGKSTLLRMIAGTEPTSSGKIVSSGTISWPVGFAGSFHGELSGAQNCRFIGRIYGVDTDQLIKFVEDFAGLGVHFHLPIKTYSSGMKSRLAFGTSMGISFDTYLVDEITAVGDASFRAKSDALFKNRMKNSGSVVVSHAMGQIRQLCDSAVVLEDGELIYFDDVEEGIKAHEINMKR
ncbi:ABC transporter ATP-binding protein [Tritonibacter mobilis]|uniref:ABC transporter ATP-binding protein n=1 Tax=Tritonibacter mobilis TaxID=379347 RepID=UPI000E0DAF0E|nr:ABC transporter ATP-binding protein [Tritonibacter mobilis]